MQMHNVYIYVYIYIPSPGRNQITFRYSIKRVKINHQQKKTKYIGFP